MPQQINDGRLLNDLRLLRLALHLEETFERYEEYLRDLIPYVPVRAKLRTLFEDGPEHRRLREMFQSLERQAQGLSGTISSQAILRSLLDCERGARHFYLTQLDRLSDPVLVDLFRSLAREEELHAKAVVEAMDLLATVERRSSEPAATEMKGASV